MKKQIRTLTRLLGFSCIFFQMLDGKTLDEKVIRVQPGQTVTFATEQSRIHSKFDIKSYELEIDGYKDAYEIHFFPPTYELRIGKHAHPGTFNVIKKNGAELSEKTYTIIVDQKIKGISLQVLNAQTVDEPIHVQPGQTVIFDTNQPNMHSNSALTIYELKEDTYHQQTHHEVQLVPPTYVLEIGENAQPGTFNVVGKNDVGLVKTTKKIIVEPKRRRTVKMEESL